MLKIEIDYRTCQSIVVLLNNLRAMAATRVLWYLIMLLANIVAYGELRTDLR